LLVATSINLQGLYPCFASRDEITLYQLVWLQAILNHLINSQVLLIVFSLLYTIPQTD